MTISSKSTTRTLRINKYRRASCLILDGLSLLLIDTFIILNFYTGKSNSCSHEIIKQRL